MLSLMRKHAASWLIKVALFIIIIVFIFWGGYSYTSRKASLLAKVNDHYITINEYNKAYDTLRENYRRQFGGNLPENLLKSLNLKKRALDLLIERYLLSSITAKLGLTATTDELKKSITRFDAFKTNGRFDPDRYNRILMRSHLTPEAFESQQAQEIALNKLQKIITRSAKVTESEIKAYFRYDRDQVKLSYVIIDPSRFQVKKEPAEIKSYFEENKEKYRQPEKRKFALVLFKYSDEEKTIKPSESEIEYYYREHKKDFYQEKQVRARHILFRISPGASEKEVKDIKAKAQGVLKLAKEGKDFAELAKKYSQDKGSSSRGGDLGFFTFKRMVKPFAEVAFSLKPGEISDLVKTSFGYHIIKVEQVKDAKELGLKEVQGKIIKILKRQKAKDYALRKATDFADFAFSVENLENAAKQKQIPVVTTSGISITDPLPLIGQQPKFMRNLFGLEENEISQPTETSVGVAVAQVLKVEEASIPDFKNVEEKVSKDWQLQESKDRAEQEAESILRDAKNKKDLSEVARKKGLTLKNVDWFSRHKPGVTFSGNTSILESVLSRTREHPFPDKPLELHGKWIVCQVTDWKAPGEKDLEKERGNIYSMLLSQKQRNLWNSWLEEMKKQADIKILREY